MRGLVTIRPDPSFLGEVERLSGEKVSRCYQCRKCTNGCPAAFAMDAVPNQVLRLVQHGLKEEVLRSSSIWICAACQACTTRCPNEIDIAHLMDVLRQLSRRTETPSAEPGVIEFHRAFLDSVRRHGRVFELGLAARYNLATRRPFGDWKLGWEMLKHGKLKFRPAQVRDRRHIREMFEEREET